jgi:hypothetical protein
MSGVNEFKNLGAALTEDNDITTEIKQRIIMANKTSYGLKKQLYSPNLKRQIKCMLYKTLIRPILMEVNAGPSQRRMEICSEPLREEY